MSSFVSRLITPMKPVLRAARLPCSRSCDPQPSYSLPSAVMKTNSSVLKQLKRSFHTTPQRNVIHPMVWRFAAPLAKLGAALFGRFFRKWYANLSPERQRRYYELFMRHRRTLIGVGVASLGLTGVYYYAHLERTPITGRLRFIAATQHQFEQMADFEAGLLMKMHHQELLPDDHKYVKRVKRLARKLIDANLDLPVLHDKQWKVFVIDTSDVNAYVVPSKIGHIFVNVGMLDVCENDDQLGIILGHEMSHAILGHGIEQLSHSQLLDKIQIVIIAALWALIWSDVAAVFAHWFSGKCAHLMLKLPYSRLLELEADSVGLVLAAKACLDVRESYAYWVKMEMMEKQGIRQHSDGRIEIPIHVPAILTTHPSHIDRAERLNALIPECIELRQNCGCPRLPRTDPRDAVDLRKRKMEEQMALRGLL